MGGDIEAEPVGLFRRGRLHLQWASGVDVRDGCHGIPSGGAVIRGLANCGEGQWACWPDDDLEVPLGHH